MDNRYNETIPPDSPVLTLGDEQIIGMDFRTQPERLQPGYAQFLQNQRLDTLAPATRLGTTKQTNAIVPNAAPLIMPFTIGAGAIMEGAVTDGIFASCVFSDPNNNNNQYIFCATATKVFTFAASSSSVTTIAYPSNEIVEIFDPSTNIFQVGGMVYLLRGDIGASFSISSVTSNTATTTATVTTTSANGLSTNMYVRLGGATQSAYNGDFQITVVNSSSFTVTLSQMASASPATGTLSLNRLKVPCVWNGNFASPFTLNAYGVIAQNFFNMPVSDWGLLQQNRVICEYNRNALIMSQINGPSAFDVINGVFDFAVGTNDYIIGATPYQDTQTVVFMRNSVWLINYVNGDVAAMTTQLISNLIGCASRNSIATCGANIVFLNERGVYLLQPGLELLLRGNALPLSAPIDAAIKTINFAAINVAYAAYFLNRYYIAVPVNGSTRNNVVFVYNFINSAWESYDTFPGSFYCDEMQVMLNASGTPTLYFISYDGGLYAAEQKETDDFAAAANPATQYLIDGLFTTRRFNFGSTGMKRFIRATITAVLDGSSAVSCEAVITNPEDTKILATITNVNATSGQTTRPSFINKRGYGVELQIANTSGRCEILNYNIGAYVQDLKTTIQN